MLLFLAERLEAVCKGIEASDKVAALRAGPINDPSGRLKLGALAG